MINENMIDPNDRVIAKLRIQNDKLRKCIEDFKAYDRKRKAHYASLEQEVGELKSYIQELEEGQGIPKSILAYKETIAQLNRYITRYKVSTNYTRQELEEAYSLAAKIELKRKIESLKEQLKTERNTSNEYLQRLLKYEHFEPMDKDKQV